MKYLQVQPTTPVLNQEKLKIMLYNKNMPAFINKKIKKILIAVSLFILFLTFAVSPLVTPIYAQNTGEEIYNLWNHNWYSEQNPFAWYQKVYDESISPSSEIFGERYTAAQVQWITYSLWAQIWNMVPGNPELTNCLINGSADQCFTIFSNAMDLVNPIASVDSPNTASGTGAVLTAINQNPISGVKYFKSVIGKFSPIKEAQAQGFGYNTAGKVSQKLWGITRNISYTFIVLAVIVMSFLIMFRVKISPQIVISVQSALPKIIVTIILITFSYAIAGFAIDLMYVVIGLIAGILTSNGLSGHTPAEMFNALNTGSALGAFGLMYGYWLGFIWNVLLVTFVNIGSTFVVFGLIYLLIAIIAILAVIWWSIKIIIVLLKNFAMIMITIIIAPLQILGGAFTSKSTFGDWLKKLFSYLAIYPLIGLMFFFANFFLAQGNDATSVSGKQAKMLYGNPIHDVIPDNDWEPPFSGIAFGDNIVWITLSFVIFSQIVKVSEIVQSAIAGKPFAFGVDIGPVAKGYGYHAAAQMSDGLGDPRGLGWLTGGLAPKTKQAISQMISGALKH